MRCVAKLENGVPRVEIFGSKGAQKGLLVADLRLDEVLEMAGALLKAYDKAENLAEEEFHFQHTRPKEEV